MADLERFWYNSGMAQRFYHVDAFTSEPYSGNPAVVCPLDGPADAVWMQQVAAEMNVSESAFFYPDGGSFHLRWFTPLTEMPLCGHATLASAHVLREEGVVPAGQTARFETASGLLPVAITEDLLEMDFPASSVHAVEPPAALLAGLGVRPVWVGEHALGLMVELESADVVRDLIPDVRSLAELPGRVVYLTARGSDPGIDYVCRVFGPKVGIPEDPVTGGAQCVLAPYWAEKLGKPELGVFQASKRGGHLWVRPAGDRVMISGQAVTTSSGELRH